jgi:hypothetical protein
MAIGYWGELRRLKISSSALKEESTWNVRNAEAKCAA